MSGSDKDQVRPAPRQLGDYLLMEQVSEDDDTRTYHARQISVDRAVILVRIKGGRESNRAKAETFLADVRAKAAIEHAGIGSVYEAVHEEAEVYWTRELLPGTTFAQIHDEGRAFTPFAIARFLRQVGGAMAYLRERALVTLPLEPEHLVLGEHEVVRIANRAVGGTPDPNAGTQDQFMVGELLLGLMQPGSPGATRTARLLGMMMGLEEGVELSWMQVANTARQLEQDLANFLLVRGPFAWLGHAWLGCSHVYQFPDALNVDYGEPVGGALCAETKPGSGVFTREWTKASVSMDCNTWTPSIVMKAAA